MARLYTGRTLGVVVPARFSLWVLDEVKDGELFSVGIGTAWRQFDRGWFAKNSPGMVIPRLSRLSSASESFFR